MEKDVKLVIKWVDKQFNLGWFGTLTRYGTAEYIGPASSFEEVKSRLNVMEGVSYDFEEVM
jgi:hypothetical protein